MEQTQPTQQYIPPKQSFDAADVQANKAIACLSYVGILFLIPLFMQPNSKYTREHVLQGIASFAVWLGLIVFGMIPLLGWVLGPLLSLGWLAINVVAILKCLQGEFWEIPYLGMHRNLFSFVYTEGPQKPMGGAPTQQQ